MEKLSPSKVTFLPENIRMILSLLKYFIFWGSFCLFILPVKLIEKQQQLSGLSLCSGDGFPWSDYTKSRSDVSTDACKQSSLIGLYIYIQRITVSHNDEMFQTQDDSSKLKWYNHPDNSYSWLIIISKFVVLCS